MTKDNIRLRNLMPFPIPSQNGKWSTLKQSNKLTILKNYWQVSIFNSINFHLYDFLAQWQLLLQLHISFYLKILYTYYKSVLLGTYTFMTTNAEFILVSENHQIKPATDLMLKTILVIVSNQFRKTNIVVYQENELYLLSPLKLGIKLSH